MKTRSPNGGSVNGDPGLRAFTLIEIMMVIGLILIMFTVAIPAFARAHGQRPMKQATEDLIELLNTARAQAIIRGVTVELRMNPQEYTFDVVAASAGGGNGGGGNASPSMA